MGKTMIIIIYLQGKYVDIYTLFWNECTDLIEQTDFKDSLIARWREG